MKNFFWEKFLKLYYKIFYPKLYISIHDKGTAYIWDKIKETEDYSLLIKKKGVDLNLINIDKIVKVWESLNDQYILEFPPKKYLKELAIRTKIALWRWKAARYNQRHLNTLAAIEEAKLDSKKIVKYEKGSFMKNIAIMKKANINIDYLKVSLFEYESYLITLSK